MFAPHALAVALAAIALSSPTPLQVAPAQDSRVAALLARADKALQGGQDSRALAILRQAWRLRPGHARTAKLYQAAMLRVGTQFLEAKELTRANDLFRQATALFPDSAALALGAGQVAVERRDAKGAEKHLRRAVELDDELVPAFVALGSFLYTERKFDDAHEYLKRALELDPKNHIALTFLRRNSDDKIVEKKFANKTSKHFRLSYHGERRGLDKHQPEILEYLELCYAGMVKLLRRKPERRIEVVLYTKTEFRVLNRNADWVAAYYDGKVRIPLDSWPISKHRVRITIRHELTHAFLHQLYGEVSSWMHEGLAQRVDGTDLEAAQKRVAEVPFFDAGRLRRSFVQERNPRKARLLYDQSLLVFAEIERRLGSRGVTPLFERIAKRDDSRGSAWKREPLASREDRVLKKLLGYDLEGIIRATARARGAAMPAK